MYQSGKSVNTFPCSFNTFPYSFNIFPCSFPNQFLLFLVFCILFSRFFYFYTKTPLFLWLNISHRANMKKNVLPIALWCTFLLILDTFLWRRCTLTAQTSFFQYLCVVTWYSDWIAVCTWFFFKKASLHCYESNPIVCFVALFKTLGFIYAIWFKGKTKAVFKHISEIITHWQKSLFTPGLDISYCLMYAVCPIYYLLSTYFAENYSMTVNLK